MTDRAHGLHLWPFGGQGTGVEQDLGLAGEAIKFKLRDLLPLIEHLKRCPQHLGRLRTLEKLTDREQITRHGVAACVFNRIKQRDTSSDRDRL